MVIGCISFLSLSYLLLVLSFSSHSSPGNQKPPVLPPTLSSSNLLQKEGLTRRFVEDSHRRLETFHVRLHANGF
ncbi:hypothetical protein NEUTE1DRAFT_116854 [Neurospora tetrasperma FGSC 2508]|uniref:Uncharacterized protein n=1 Tax=Neurospora tetrasperma (strain FGSC 2508 / ATCC MYA-4615 / P0657) TaxID=510951 RepID=F8ML73_NEUT8|nr:uncharacterized protein NEUTE1DRAFT_116854 [Neurospora tetrasperma FGSC 2508]EGO57548.1 hypothetical protein NEUTE1DRAFT_116854 [Neurospora tetrasperma FGSC 2508]EGZ72193.1 hypothetical protein NEUTE2DRAFT_144753 [Neurospora tetrasperma FGSC 2509]